MTKKYNYENLINDINNLDLVTHRHFISHHKKQRQVFMTM